ncbi:MAG: hypothetical protein ACNA7T_05125 [Haliea sp.]
MIQEQNIKFLESQVMDDVDNGGGAATNREILDGRMNNVFDDISDLDRAYGRFNLRKIFLAVRTLSTDLYGGAKTCITALPEDPAIAYTIFSRGDQYDTRATASNQVESYLHKSLGWHGLMFGNHLQNMRTLTLFQRIGTRLPPIGKTLCIVQNEGLSTEIEQYVRVIDLDVEERTFEYFDSSGNLRTFNRWIVTHTLSDPLRTDFTGHEPGPTMAANFSNRAMVRDTYVVDAAVYYSTRRTQAPAAIGDQTVRVDSIFSQLVPSAETENPILNMPINPDITITMDAGARQVEVPQQAHTKAVQVTSENRRTTWVETLSPIPKPGTLTISYMAQGNWYQIQDNGEGGISGEDPILGAGAIDYASGTMSITLGVLPDADSEIIMIWASPVHYQKFVGHPNIDTAAELHYEMGESFKPGTLVLTWLQDGLTKTATADVYGQITGDATGYASHVAGEFWLVIDSVPDFNSKLGVDYQRQDRVEVTFPSVSTTNGIISINLGTAVEPGSVEVRATVEHKTIYSRVVHTRHPGYWGNSSLGHYRMLASMVPAPVLERTITRITDDALGGWPDADGAINYTTGQLTLAPFVLDTRSRWDYVTGAWLQNVVVQQTETTHRLLNNTVTVWYTPAGAAQTAVSYELDLAPISFRVVPRLIDATVVPNSLRFTWNGKEYDDRDGIIYTDIDPVTQAGVPAGTIDYVSGIVSLTYYASGSGAVAITSLLGVWGEWHTNEGFFRTEANPLKPESLQLLANTTEGEQIIAMADASGNFTHPLVTGTVNYSLGLARVEFTKPVLPSSIRYNAVAFSYLPLDAGILGIESVRLPSDGRVPVFRTGNVVLVMHHAETAPQTVASGGTISCDRTRISWVRITDANGEPVRDNYELDRENGIVTITDATGIAMPITVRHTVSDLRVALDVQITGYIKLSRPLTHDYPAGETYVASCLIHGDRRARVLDVWDQATWNGQWSDLHGTPASATLNLIDHPITVTNEGCDTDRWVLRWLTSTTVELISEKRGLIWSGSYTAGGADIAPINPRTREWDEQVQEWVGGVPYMVIPGAANGGGWSAGNVLRINAEGAISDIWIARAINQSDEPMDDGEDGCEIYALGNIDRP